MTIKEYNKRWLRRFAADVSEREIQECIMDAGGFIWHVFSWGLISEGDYLTGNAARRAFDEVNKEEALYIKPFGRGGTKTLPADLASASALDELAEVYVAAADFSWTYIKTHERMCGPYFCERNPSKYDSTAGMN